MLPMSRFASATLSGLSSPLFAGLAFVLALPALAVLASWLQWTPQTLDLLRIMGPAAQSRPIVLLTSFRTPVLEPEAAALLSELVADLEAFADPRTGLASRGVSPEHGWGVEQRLEFARTIEELTELLQVAPAHAARHVPGERTQRAPDQQVRALIEPERLNIDSRLR